MKQDLLKYMSERYPKETDKQRYPGPVITISREYGCPAKAIAEKLATILSEKLINQGKNKVWRWISKEILDEAAKELNVDPANIQYVFEYKKKGLIDDILSAQSRKYYKSDRKIRQTIAHVIRNISYDGNVIIIGRGGIAITRDIPKSLHINLEAPLDWRALRISEKHQVSFEDAIKLANDTDKKRREFREYFEGKNSDYTRFDITFNCMTLSIDEIVNDIANMVIIRKLF